jgi:hypothetical protein
VIPVTNYYCHPGYDSSRKPPRARPQQLSYGLPEVGAKSLPEVRFMLPVLLSVWIALVVVMAGLYIYRSTLTKNEEDQIFLDDSFSHEKAAQAAIIAKLNKVQPFVRGASWLVGAATLCIVAYFVWDIFNQFK